MADTAPAGIYYKDSNVNLDAAVNAAKKAVETADADVAEKLKALETDTGGKLDPAALANVQHALNQWSISYNLAASTNRSIKDLMSGIIQKI
ncbi:type III secretion system needle filament subunit SctF [Endozoicomonas sp. Mp262]|uniref:type III secretion system needle filament subunit SctF n=1 Tax=Endozoicomonas sp. Mp262 TaxID=2919499 RepID=UPI0021DAB49B